MLPFLIFDIETAARAEAEAFLPEPSAPANYKDVDKIAAYIAERRAEQLSKAALDPDLGQIIAVAYKLHPCPAGEDRSTAVLVGDDGATEADLLALLWRQIGEVKGWTIGYNILGFDLPYILRRSMALGVRPTIIPQMARYRTEPVRDLMAILYNWTSTTKSLKTVVKMYGIPNPLPDLDGSQVMMMDPKTLRRYVANDVSLVAALYDRMDGYYWPASRHEEG